MNSSELSIQTAGKGEARHGRLRRGRVVVAAAGVIAVCVGALGFAPWRQTAKQAVPEPAMSAEDLARIVVPQDQLGMASAGLSLGAEDQLSAEDTGLTCDRAATQTLAASLGYVSGHALAYSLDEPGTVGTNGLLRVETRVHLFADAPGAERAFDARKQSLLADCPRSVEITQTNEDHREFTPDLEAPRVAGITYTIVASKGSARLYDTFVLFQTGRLVGEAIVTTDIRDDRTGDATRLASALQARLDAVRNEARDRVASGVEPSLQLALAGHGDDPAAEERFVAAAANVIGLEGELPDGYEVQDANVSFEHGECGGPRLAASYSTQDRPDVINGHILLLADVSVQAYAGADVARRCAELARSDHASDQACREALKDLVPDEPGWSVLSCSVDGLAGRDSADNGWALEQDAIVSAPRGRMEVHRFVSEVQVGSYVIYLSTYLAGKSDPRMSLDLLRGMTDRATKALPTLNAVAYSVTARETSPTGQTAPRQPARQVVPADDTPLMRSSAIVSPAAS